MPLMTLSWAPMCPYWSLLSGIIPSFLWQLSFNVVAKSYAQDGLDGDKVYDKALFT
ncbi:hypothetical protein SCLCIDRAFT_1223639 [Scleroderma citrinum Foug A]|uniref:Uncharacterized protein n=1 Tax=Scleroderma citrinum Foug A TaxID=1036808 RepID=A0A0C2YS80_9AGAM|nr:hypothetical protein SCLCIDRAFT_1223639 [Scleroderma citrinum Foug A]